MFKNQIIVGLYGHAGVGKDHVAGILEKSYGFTHLKFAEHIKRAITALFPWYNLENLKTSGLQPAFGNKEYSYRQIMQLMGRLVFDTFGPAVSVQNMMMMLREAEPTPCVISDIRRTCEYQFLRENGAIIIQIARKGYISLNDDPTEVEMDAFAYDYLIDAETLSMQRKQVIEIMKQIFDEKRRGCKNND